MCPVIIMIQANKISFAVQFKLVFINEHEGKRMMLLIFNTCLKMVESCNGSVNEGSSIELLEKAFVEKDAEIRKRGIEPRNVIYFEAMFPNYWEMKEFLELLKNANI